MIRGRASAPGKVVLSGSYSVLGGAPAIVAAVDRYVVADASRPADRITAEVRAAIDAGYLDRAPWFDASALREPQPDGSTRKLGLGSSAAIVAASLAAASSIDKPINKLFAEALSAHRAAQGGGSGIDVAASVFGGVLLCRLHPPTGRLDIAPLSLPPGLVVEVFVSPVSAETRALLSLARSFSVAQPDRARSLLARASAGAEAAASARTPCRFIKAFAKQVRALGELGLLAGSPIVTSETAKVAELAAQEEAAFGPSGAGGGDISIYFGKAPSSPALRELASKLGFTRLGLRIGAPAGE